MQVINELVSYSITLKTFVFLLLGKFWVFPYFTLIYEDVIFKAKTMVGISGFDSPRQSLRLNVLLCLPGC